MSGPLLPGRTCTLAKCAAAIGVNVESARRIEQRALAKARRYCDAHGLTLDDLVPDPAPDGHWDRIMEAES